MRSGRKPTLGDEIADAYIFPECTTRRPRIPEIRVLSPGGSDARPLGDICQPPCPDGPLERQRRKRLRESLAELEELLGGQACLVETEKHQSPEAKPTANKWAVPEEKPPQKDGEAPGANKPPKGKAPQAPGRPGTFRTFLAFGRQLISSRHTTTSRLGRYSVMG
ncbi:hypothetical protein MKX07_007114 [Trichoderma sp. CBMAI-0711]|nr:hypothetical protein MKX07_007114 [Trichoderma sp. CBMAI-0711]